MDCGFGNGDCAMLFVDGRGLEGLGEGRPVMCPSQVAIKFRVLRVGRDKVHAPHFELVGP